MDFKTLFRNYRERSGLNKTELANKLGISLTHVIHIEDGDRDPPPLEKIPAIADALNLSKKEKEEFLRAATPQICPPSILAQQGLKTLTTDGELK